MDFQGRALFRLATVNLKLGFFAILGLYFMNNSKTTLAGGPFLSDSVGCGWVASTNQSFLKSFSLHDREIV